MKRYNLREKYEFLKNHYDKLGYDIITRPSEFLTNINTVKVSTKYTEKQMVTELLTLIDLCNKEQNVVNNIYLRDVNNNTIILPKVWIETGQVIEIEKVKSTKNYPKEISVKNINIPRQVDILFEDNNEFVSIEL